MKLGTAAWSLALSASLMTAPAALAQDPREIVRKSLERDWTDFSTQRNYTYQQHTEFRELGNDGKLRHKRSETAEILVLGGRRYERKIAKDDMPLRDSEERREKEKLDRAAARYERESPAERASFQNERAKDRAYLREIPDAFVFTLRGTETVSGAPAWVIDAEPKPGYRPTNSRANLFTKVRVKAWIEKETYHWVKMQADALDTLSFGLGLFRVAPGMKLEFEQTRVNDEIWLPSLMHLRGDARLALIKKLHGEVDVQYRGYRKFQTESRVLGAQEIGGNE